MTDVSYKRFEMEGVLERRIIVPAFYEAHCVRTKKYPYYGKGKICLTWNFFRSGAEDLELPQHINISDRIKTNMTYYKQWIQFSGGRRPRVLSMEYMSPRVFLQKSQGLPTVFPLYHEHERGR